jgi:hypothetical protein
MLIHPTLSPGRRAWLEKLARDGKASRPRGNVGYDCMQLGWTEWAVMTADGAVMGWAEAGAKYPGAWRSSPMVGEMLTDEGRRVLLRAMLEDDQPQGENR